MRVLVYVLGFVNLRSGLLCSDTIEKARRGEPGRALRVLEFSLASGETASSDPETKTAVPKSRAVLPVSGTE